MGREVGRGSELGTRVHSWRIHVDVWEVTGSSQECQVCHNEGTAKRIYPSSEARGSGREELPPI